MLNEKQIVYLIGIGVGFCLHKWITYGSDEWYNRRLKRKMCKVMDVYIDRYGDDVVYEAETILRHANLGE